MTNLKYSMAEHILKTDPKVFKDSWDETKQFEIRLDDRNFQVGDTLFLRETEFSGKEMEEGFVLNYTGRFIELDVIYKLEGEYGLQPGWCILGTSLITTGEKWYED